MAPYGAQFVWETEYDTARTDPSVFRQFTPLMCTLPNTMVLSTPWPLERLIWSFIGGEDVDRQMSLSMPTYMHSLSPESVPVRYLSGFMYFSPISSWLVVPLVMSAIRTSLLT